MRTGYIVVVAPLPPDGGRYDNEVARNCAVATEPVPPGQVSLIAC